jgi:hypothetical protein
MKAIEFSGNIKDGILKIPKKLLPNVSDRSVRIIILVEEQQSPRKKPSLKNRFKSLKLDTRDFKFDRDEANER